MGDLPVLAVNPNDEANKVVTVPHLKELDTHGRSILIHVGGDNYSDMPLPLGGGGARIACGVIAQAEVNENSQDLNSGDVGNLFTLFYSLLNNP